MTPRPECPICHLEMVRQPRRNAYTCANTRDRSHVLARQARRAADDYARLAALLGETTS